MSRTAGEGRAPAEKAGRIVEDPAATRRRRAAAKAERERWEAMNGPVVVTKKEPS